MPTNPTTNVKRLFAVVALALAFAGCAAEVDQPNTATDKPATTVRPTTTAAPTTAAAPTTTVATAPPEDPEVTAARDSAASYLETVGGFSRDGLIGQVMYEGFSDTAAAQAVDSLNVDWSAQAVESAQSYMDSVGGFSHSGLVEQLEYEGFSAEDAEAAATRVLGF